MAAEGAVSPAPSRRSPYYMYMYMFKLNRAGPCRHDCSCTEKIFQLTILAVLLCAECAHSTCMVFALSVFRSG